MSNPSHEGKPNHEPAIEPDIDAILAELKGEAPNLSVAKMFKGIQTFAQNHSEGLKELKEQGIPPGFLGVDYATGEDGRIIKDRNGSPVRREDMPNHRIPKAATNPFDAKE